MQTVLIVDNCPAVRKTLRSLLERQLSSVMCIEAANGLDAIAMTEVSCPNLIILDLGTPEMNGFDTATVLHETKPQVPLFMFTSHDSREVESQAASVGILAVFSKYTGIDALLARVSELLNSSRALATQEA
jgi:two-component system invasion response regulator UvrY